MLSQDINDYEKSTVQYFNEISDYVPLSREEEKELFYKYKNEGDMNARDRILKSNLKFVINVAKHYKGKGLSFADIVAEGNLGMIKAMDKFDPDKDFKFISYAVWWIKQGILEAINKRNNLPAEELPTDHENNDISDDDNIKEIVSSDFIAEKEYDKERDIDIKNTIDSLFETLTDREKDIVIQLMGLDGKKPKTLDEVGYQYNLTKERVRQIKEKAFKKIRSDALNKCITSDIYR